MEVLDISTSNGTTKVCQASTLAYPLDIRYATGAVVGNESVICGGSSCYVLGQEKHWKLLGQMSTPRSSSASVPVANGLWITGGWNDGSNNLNSTDIIYLNGSSIIMYLIHI